MLVVGGEGGAGGGVGGGGGGIGERGNLFGVVGLDGDGGDSGGPQCRESVAVVAQCAANRIRGFECALGCGYV